MLTAIACLMQMAVSAQDRDSFTVYLFLLEDCKVTQAYTDRLAEIHHRYSGDSIGFVALFPNPISSDSTVSAFQQKHGLAFPCTVLQPPGKPTRSASPSPRKPPLSMKAPRNCSTGGASTTCSNGWGNAGASSPRLNWKRPFTPCASAQRCRCPAPVPSAASCRGNSNRLVATGATKRGKRAFLPTHFPCFTEPLQQA